MSAGNYSFTIDQGTTVKFELQYKYCDGTPFDLSGYSGKMSIKVYNYDNGYNSCACTSTYPCTDTTQKIGIDYPFVVSSSINSDGTGLNFSGSNGTTPIQSGSIGITISSTTSSLFTFDQLEYEIDIRNSNEVIRVLQGIINVDRML